MLQLLIAEDVFLNAVDVNGNTPLHCASQNGQSETAKASQQTASYSSLMVYFQVLVDAGTSKTITNNDGETPFDVICAETDSNCSESTRTFLKKLLRP